MMIKQQLYPELYEAVKHSKLRAVGHQAVQDYAHAMFMVALLKAYGQEAGLLYAEAIIEDLAPDLVLAQAQTGLIVFEVKAYDLDFILGAEAGNLKIRRHGEIVEVNPLRQAQRSMYAIKNHYEQVALDFQRPLFNAMVVLPNISESVWEAAGYETSSPRRVTLFAEDCADPERLKAKIGRQVHQTLHISGLPEPYPPSAESTLLRVFGQSTLLSPAPRQVVRPLQVEQLGRKIDALEAATRSLSLEQQQLARLDTWGHPFLLRGVAGSGKSLVLAYQVAWALLRHERQHQQLTLFAEDRHPLPRIAVLGVSRSLMPMLDGMIRSAYREIAGQELASDCLTVNHINGWLFSLAQAHSFFHYVAATRDMAKQAREYLAQLERLSPAQLDQLRVDALYIDEGQDLHEEMFRLLNRLVRPDPHTTERSLAVFYDDAQNIYGHARPTWNAFGWNVEGSRAAFMRSCYRNSREIVELGLNVLLGTAADERIRVQTRRYADIYTLQEKGLVTETAQGWRVHFAEPSGEIPQVRVFNSRAEQTDWVAAGLLHLLEVEAVRPQDVLVLARSATALGYLEAALHSLGNGRIKVRVVGGKDRSTLDEALLQPGQLTLSTIHAAKGYDAPIVFVLDLDQLERNVTGRSLFYVAATRAKRYLILCGVKQPRSLLSEAQAVHHSLFEAE